MFNLLIFRNPIGYIPRLYVMYLVLEQLVIPPIYTPHIVGNQFTIMIQLVVNKDKGPIQQQIIASMTSIITINIEIH